MYGGWLHIGYHAHDSLRQADGADATGVGSGEEGAGGRVCGGAGRRHVRVGRRRRAKGDHRRRLWPRLQGAGPSPPHGPRHWARWARVDELRAGEQDAHPARHVLQRRAHDRELRRVRDPARGLSAHHGERTRLFHRAGAFDRAGDVGTVLNFTTLIGIACGILFYRAAEYERMSPWLWAIASVGLSLIVDLMTRSIMAVLVSQVVLFGIMWWYNAKRPAPGS